MEDKDRMNYKSTLMIKAHVANLKVKSSSKLYINQNLTLQDVIKLHPSATVLDIEDLIQDALMEIEDYRTEIEQNEVRIKALEDKVHELRGLK